MQVATAISYLSLHEMNIDKIKLQTKNHFLNALLL